MVQTMTHVSVTVPTSCRVPCADGQLMPSPAALLLLLQVPAPQRLRRHPPVPWTACQAQPAVQPHQSRPVAVLPPTTAAGRTQTAAVQQPSGWAVCQLHTWARCCQIHHLATSVAAAVAAAPASASRPALVGQCRPLSCWPPSPAPTRAHNRPEQLSAGAGTPVCSRKLVHIPQLTHAATRTHTHMPVPVKAAPAPPL